MQKKRSRICSIALAAVLLTQVLSGCTGQEDSAHVLNVAPTWWWPPADRA